MAYIKKIIAPDEELIGIARLHWVYVLRGLSYFLVMAGGGWLLNYLAMRAGVLIGGSFNSDALPLLLMKVANGIMFFMMAGGFFMFCLFVMKVLVTEIGLSSRRVLHKEGWLFVKVHQIDHEEIRGENLDLGYLGRILGYGYIMLDCRFVGDVKLPAMENPERFLRVLHKVRSGTQDALSLMVGKNASVVPLKMHGGEEQGQEQPAPQTPQPEVQPGQPGPAPEKAPPETPTTPTPHTPPTPQTPPSQPERPEVPPTQPTPAPTPTEPPLQPPSGVTLPSQVASGAAAGATAASSVSQQNDHPPAQPDAAAMMEMMKQMMPQMAEEVAKQLAAQQHQADASPKPLDVPPLDEKAVDTDLIASFGQASEGDTDDVRNKLGRSIH